MEEEEKVELSHYQKYKTTIIESRKKWMNKNLDKFYQNIQFRNQLHKYSYKMINKLIEDGKIPNSIKDDIINQTKENVEKLRSANK